MRSGFDAKGLCQAQRHTDMPEVYRPVISDWRAPKAQKGLFEVILPKDSNLSPWLQGADFDDLLKDKNWQADEIIRCVRSRGISL